MSLEREGAEGSQSVQAQEVVVLAKNFKLTDSQRRLLSKGLTYVPTLDIGKDGRDQFQLDMQNYHRKLKLATHYRNSKKRDKLPFIGPSIWEPPWNLIPTPVQNLISTDRDVFRTHFKSQDEKPNISWQEVKALRELIRTKHMVIKPADKGSAVVIMSREQYMFEVERQLNDPVYYKKLEKPMYMDTVPMVIDILDTLKKKKFINAKQRQYLIGKFEPRERRFYILPKIHKEPHKWTVPFEIPPGRPIVSDCGSETYLIAEYLDYYLNPLSITHPAYVKDTYHFIEIVKSLTLTSDSAFFSMDVDNLYTNIPIEAGINCVRTVFERNPDPKRPDQELLRLLEISLTRNDFVFNEKYYLQVKGTAMGKRFAPAYANIFMANWEQEVLAKCETKPKCYLRYLDDIWGVWSESREEFDNFVQILNTHDPSITLKKEFDEHSIDFLDTTVFKGPDFLQTRKLDIKVHFKTTDTHALLHRRSFHPTHCFRGIVKAQLLRFARICTRRVEFFEAVKTLFKALRNRGYPRSFLRDCFKTFRESKALDDRNIIPLITSYSSTSKVLNGKFKTNFDTIPDVQQFLPSSKVISAYRRNKNLRDYLVKARLPSLTVRKPQLLESQFVRLKFVKSADKKVFRVEQGFSTDSKNCIYVIFCSRCGVQYVGETKNTLSTRMMQHRYNVKNKKSTDTLLVQHFLIHGEEAMRMAGLQRNVSWTDWERKKKEKYWIFLLGTKEPSGLNMLN